MIENIQQIKDCIDIVQIIESYLPLKKSGANYLANCPFHNEKSPSFVVNKQKNMFHCFGCGEGGNGIDFIIKYDRLDFIEATHKAARLCNIDVVEKVDIHFSKKRDKIKDMQDRLETLQKEQLKALTKHEKLIAYLLKRGFKYEDIEKHDLGYNLDSKIIIDIMSEKYAKELNLITEKNYNFFNNRLMFAIRNSNNKIVGFSGRIHDYYNFTNQAKYINSTDSILYKKSDILYNYNHAKELLRNRNEIYIVEGYFDAITCNLLGIPSVALCGTALNANQIGRASCRERV